MNISMMRVSGAMQNALMDDPSAGDVIQGTGGLRKLRWADKQRGKGKRGGLHELYIFTGSVDWSLPGFSLYMTRMN